jgi:nanoRNase/pAp phosphatase (c-di-AMP/oligoRNAs hydrolase)
MIITDGLSGSLRRIHEDSDIDLSEIAKAHGGGGHSAAAGFRLSDEQISEIVDIIVKGKRRSLWSLIVSTIFSRKKNKH